MTSALGKDLLGLEPLSGDQIRLILDTAEPFKEISERAIKKVPTLRGYTVVNLFFESSTRTRSSFEIAEKRLSADNINFSASGSALSKGESLVDTALVGRLGAVPLAALGVSGSWLAFETGAKAAPPPSSRRASSRGSGLSSTGWTKPSSPASSKLTR